eukprot:82270_1
MSALLIGFIVWILLLKVQSQSSFSLSSWTKSTTTLPEANRAFACGYYTPTNSIYIVGGAVGTHTEVYEYDMTNDKWTPQSSLASSEYFWGQGWVQYNQRIYFVNRHEIGTFNMATSTPTLSITSHTVNPHGRRACVAISNDGRYLFIVGGCTSVSDCPDSALNSFQIYDTQGDTLSNGPGITTARSYHTCIVNNNGHLYVLGGLDGSFLDSIERIDVSNPVLISLQQWEFIDSLNQPTLDLRTITMNDDIYILGGRGVNTVEVIYGTDPRIVYSDNNLPIGIQNGCVVTVNQQIYHLGGRNSGNNLDSIYWAKLVTPSPTPSPTPAPITSPTLIPTPLPTALCPDYTTSMISNDGQDATYDSFSEFAQHFQWNMTDNGTVLYSVIMNNTLLYNQIESSKASIKCNNNSDICYISCVKTDSCAESYVNATT